MVFIQNGFTAPNVSLGPTAPICKSPLAIPTLSFLAIAGIGFFSLAQRQGGLAGLLARPLRRKFVFFRRVSDAVNAIVNCGGREVLCLFRP